MVKSSKIRVIASSVGFVWIAWAWGIGSARSEENGERLMLKYQCFECHRGDVQVIGPALGVIALRYSSGDEGLIQTLSKKVINGGYGNWGVVPMVSYPEVTETDAQVMVRYILKSYGESKEIKNSVSGEAGRTNTPVVAPP